MRGHQLRAKADAILVGCGTIIADDPELSVRYVDGCSPTKIVLDTQLKIGLNAKIFGGAPLIIATAEEMCKKRIKEREKKSAQIWQLPIRNGQIDLKALLQKAALSGMRHILIEGGSRVAASALIRMCRIPDRAAHPDRRRQPRSCIGIVPGPGRSDSRVCRAQNSGRGNTLNRIIKHGFNHRCDSA